MTYPNQDPYAPRPLASPQPAPHMQQPQSQPPAGYPNTTAPGVVSTSAVADDSTGTRIGKAIFKTKFNAASLGTSMVGIAVGITAFRGVKMAVGGDFDFGRLLITFGAVLAFTAFIGVIVVGIAAVVTPGQGRKMIPAGSPMAAQFGPTFIGFQGGQTNVRIDYVQIKLVTMVQAVQVMTVFVDGQRQPVFIPGELVPPQVAAGLTQRFSAEAMLTRKSAPTS